MSVMEISHRSKAFEEIIQGAEADVRALAGVPAGYKVLFLQGGASLQFSMVPMNLLAPGATADYILTGDWSKKALKEAKRVGATHVSATTEEGGFKRIPKASEIKYTDGRRLRAHDVEQHDLRHRVGPRAGRDARRRSSATRRPTSSRGRIDVSKFGLIYAGAQKNLGPSGVTLVIIREDLLARSTDALPVMLNYKTMAENGSMYNTPPVFGIYILRLVLKWLVNIGRASGHRRR